MKGEEVEEENSGVEIQGKSLEPFVDTIVTLEEQDF
jgi:hypothetical protein